MPIGRTITSWTFSQMLWDAGDSPRQGFLGALWAAETAGCSGRVDCA